MPEQLGIFNILDTGGVQENSSSKPWFSKLKIDFVFKK